MRSNIEKGGVVKVIKTWTTLPQLKRETTNINGVWVGKEIHSCALTWKSCKQNLKAHCKCLFYNAEFYHLIYCNIQRTAIVTLALAFWHSLLNQFLILRFKSTLDLISCHIQIPHIS